MSSLDVLRVEGERLVDAARVRGPEGPVVACPGWTVNDLAGHVGSVYRWVAAIIGSRRTAPPSAEERASFGDPDPSDADGVIERLLEAHRQIVELLRAAPPDLDVWTTWPVDASGRDFWIRRMVHETLVHRVDAEDDGSHPETLGRDLDPMVAADGIDEMVCGFAQRYGQTLRAGGPVTLTVEPSDAGGQWWIRLSPGEPVFGRGVPPESADPLAATVHIEGTAGELLLLLWNRRPPTRMTVTGDASALEAWRIGAHL